MSKLLLGSLGAVGAGGAGIGSYMLLNPSEKQKTEKVITFKEKYSHSLLDLNGSKDDTIGQTKLAALKSQTPNHPDLQKASTVAKGGGGEEKAKPLHKEACRKIYDSSSDNSDYLEDFKKYCSKLIGDLITETGISSESSSDSKGDSKLGTLNSKKGELISQKLKDLVAKLPTGNNNNFTAEQRKELQDGCSPQKEQLFLGEESNVIEEIKNYCTGN